MKHIFYIFLGCFLVLNLCPQNARSEIQSGIYWSNQSGTINRSDLEGQNITTLYTDPPGDINLIDIAIDQISESIFFTGFGYNVPSKIQRLDLNGGTTDLLYQTSDAPTSSPAIRSIAINPDEGKMYWTEEFPIISQGRVARANLDGSNVEYILTTSSNNRMMPYDIDIDTVSNKLYWTDYRFREIYKCDTDGSNLEHLVHTDSTTTGISLDIDAGKMYWVERFGNIMRSNLDGSDVETLLDHQTDVIDLGLDLYSNKLYWADYFNGIIYRSNLDGSGIEELIAGQTLPMGMAIVPIPGASIKVAIDIKPQSCPNPLNVKSGGVLPIAILGTDIFDANTIDPTSVRLNEVEPIRSSLEDVATQLTEPNECECSTFGPDGFIDLTLKFKTQDIVEILGEVNTGDILTLPLTGVLNDETLIEGEDCVVIVGRHKPINKADINKDGLVNTVDIAIVAENWLQSSIVED